MSAPNPAFSLTGVGLAYAGRSVLSAVDLQIAAGERVALLGESGAGKTTLLRSLREQRASEVAWCPQHAGLVPMLSVFHNIYMGRLADYSSWYNLRNLVLPAEARRAEVEALAAELGMADKLFTSVDRLSGGQQSRVALGRALYQQREIFLGDEPLSAVDEVQASQLLGLLCERHQTVVVALHDVDLALRHCNRFVGLRDGRVTLDMSSEQVCADQLRALY